MKYDLEYFQEWLNGYVNFEQATDARLFRLETTERLAELFGHPELSYRTYHVTGSKGKGSVAKMLACVLAKRDGAGPVGVYASPHAYDFRERVGTAEGFLEDKVYEKTVEELTKKVDGLKDARTLGSWFELNAVFAFLAFKNAGCSDCVFEVGMGGRLDATNVIRPEMGLITEIELEHTEFLGDTVEKIAREKAGIIKDGTPVVIAEQKSESVREVFREVAAEKRAPIYFVDELSKMEDLRYEDGELCFSVEGEIFKRPLNVRLKMLAKVQAKNAMQVAVAAKILDSDFPEEAIERGLARARLPGRFEVRKMADGGEVILDGAHTFQSIWETMETFENIYPAKGQNLLFGIAQGKDVEKIVPLFKDKFGKIFVTRPGNFKKSDMGVVEAAFKKAEMEADFNEDYEQEIKKALLVSAGKPLLVTGSFYLLDETNKIIKDMV